MLALYVERLSLGLPGHVTSEAWEKGAGERIRLLSTVDAASEDVIWRCTHTLNPASRTLHCNETFVKSSERGAEIGTTIMRNTIVLATELGLEAVTLVATGGGSYIAAKAGFFPQPTHWSGPMRKALLSTMDACSPNVPADAAAVARLLIENENPIAIAAIAGLRTVVSSTDGRHDGSGYVSLGYALLTSLPTWHGSRSIAEFGRHSFAPEGSE